MFCQKFIRQLGIYFLAIVSYSSCTHTELMSCISDAERLQSIEQYMD